MESRRTVKSDIGEDSRRRSAFERADRDPSSIDDVSTSIQQVFCRLASLFRFLLQRRGGGLM